MKKAYIFLAEGFEEVEAVTPLDMLRRKGIDAKFISISDKKEVTGSHKITYLADEIFESAVFDDGDAFILPGGLPGTTNLNSHEKLKSLISKKHAEGKLIAAICAAPSILSELGILKNIEATIYPTLKDKLTDAIASDNKVCVSGNIITANAVSSSIDFSLEIIGKLLSIEEKDALKNEIVY